MWGVYSLLWDTVKEIEIIWLILQYVAGSSLVFEVIDYV